jgi:hypothetical protein
MFLDGVVQRLEAFAALVGVQPDDVFVRVIFTDGEFLLARRMAFMDPSAEGQWGMIVNEGRDPPEAVLIREADVYQIRFEVVGRSTGIGYQTEGGPADRS